jgi:hypothetical protein
MRINPDEAEKYAQTILSKSYDRDTALKLLHSFRIVQEIDKCCTLGKYKEIEDKLHLLLSALESAGAGDNLIRIVRNNLEAVRFTGEMEYSAERAKKLCKNLVDVWINEVLRA